MFLNIFLILVRCWKLVSLRRGFLGGDNSLMFMKKWRIVFAPDKRCLGVVLPVDLRLFIKKTLLFISGSQPPAGRLLHSHQSSDKWAIIEDRLRFKSVHFVCRAEGLLGDKRRIVCFLWVALLGVRPAGNSLTINTITWRNCWWVYICVHVRVCVCVCVRVCVCLISSLYRSWERWPT